MRLIAKYMMGGGMQTNRIILSALCFAVSLCTYADFGSVHSEASGNPALQQSIDEHNLPAPDSGIQIVPSKQMMPIKSVGAMSLLDEIEQEKRLGYVQKESDDAVQLLTVKKNKFYVGDKKTFSENNDPYDTHLKASLSQIKLAFPFNGISFISKSNVIGFAVAGTWVNGWTGIGETFIDDEVGVCDYVKNNLQLTHGAAMLAKENVTYEVNSKPTIAFVEGEKKNGFTYKVEWFDNTYFHTLKCATENFIKGNKSKTIKLAQLIDSDPQ
jgi:hypothetical protein